MLHGSDPVFWKDISGAPAPLFLILNFLIFSCGRYAPLCKFAKRRIVRVVYRLLFIVRLKILPHLAWHGLSFGADIFASEGVCMCGVVRAFG